MCSVLGNKLPFAGSQDKPKCQQHANRDEIIANLLVDDTPSDRLAPCNHKRDLDHASDHDQKHFKDRFIYLGMERTGIICDYKQSSDTNCV